MLKPFVNALRSLFQKGLGADESTGEHPLQTEANTIASLYAEDKVLGRHKISASQLY